MLARTGHGRFDGLAVRYRTAVDREHVIAERLAVIQQDAARDRIEAAALAPSPLHFVLLQQRLKIEHALGQRHIVGDVARQFARSKGLGLLGQHRDLHMRQRLALEMFEQTNMGGPHTPQD